MKFHHIDIAPDAARAYFTCGGVHYGIRISDSGRDEPLDVPVSIDRERAGKYENVVTARDALETFHSRSQHLGTVRLREIRPDAGGFRRIAAFLRAHLGSMLERSAGIPPERRAEILQAYLSRSTVHQADASFDETHPSTMNRHQFDFGAGEPGARAFWLTVTLQSDGRVDLVCARRDRANYLFEGDLDAALAAGDGVIFADMGPAHCRFLDTHLGTILQRSGMSAHRTIALVGAYRRSYAAAASARLLSHPKIEKGARVRLHPRERQSYPTIGDAVLEVVTGRRRGVKPVFRRVGSPVEFTFKSRVRMIHALEIACTSRPTAQSGGSAAAS